MSLSLRGWFYGYIYIHISTLQLLYRILHIFRPVLFLTLLVSVKGEVYI